MPTDPLAAEISECIQGGRWTTAQEHVVAMWKLGKQGQVEAGKWKYRVLQYQKEAEERQRIAEQQRTGQITKLVKAINHALEVQDFPGAWRYLEDLQKIGVEGKVEVVRLRERIDKDEHDAEKRTTRRQYLEQTIEDQIHLGNLKQAGKLLNELEELDEHGKEATKRLSAQMAEAQRLSLDHPKGKYARNSVKPKPFWMMWTGGVVILIVLVLGMFWMGQNRISPQIIGMQVIEQYQSTSQTVPLVIGTTPTFPPTLTKSSTSTRQVSPYYTSTVTVTNTFTPTITSKPLTIGSTTISEVDGMVMMYVPAGEFLMGSSDKDQAKADEKPQHMVYLDAYWIDQTEVTIDMYSRYKFDAIDGGMVFVTDTNRNDQTSGNFPANLMDWTDANGYCLWAGRQLPSEAQWEKAARGTDGRTNPWGEEIDCTFANYNFCGSSNIITSVGSYPLGASPYGVLDMIGNVSEWVADWYDENYYAGSDNINPTGPSSGEERVIRGGDESGNTFSNTRSASRYSLIPDYYAADRLGFRCMLPQSIGNDPSLVNQPASQVTKPIHSPTPITTVDSTEASDNLMKVSEKDGMVMVYVPEGNFQMGSKSEQLDLFFSDPNDYRHSFRSGSQHTVYMDAYWIDQTEVTNAMYATFLNQVENQGEKEFIWMDSESRYARIHLSDSTWKADPEYEEHPVIKVTWYGAQAYCEWMGRRLPTEAEWEKAARGTDGRTYPWGVGINCSMANYAGCIGESAVVGSFPNGASIYGVLDMVGNVWEWTADWYGNDYYENSPASNPQGPSKGVQRVARGGSWKIWELGLHLANRISIPPEFPLTDTGFRCALSAGS